MTERILASQKVWFTNLDTLEERFVQFNPTELAHGIAAEYTQFTAVGLPYQPQQFSHTTNREFTFTLPFKVEGPTDLKNFWSTFNFLTACTHPAEPGAAPPTVLFNWPNLATVVVKIVSVDARHLQFDADLNPTRTDLDITLRTIRNRPRLYGDVRLNGLFE